MKKSLLYLIISFILAGPAFSQFVSEGRTIVGSTAMPAPSKVSARSALKPTSCKSDTTTYPRFYTTAYNSVTVRTGSSLGQYFASPQSITVSGFYFYAFAVTPNPARAVAMRLRCNVYKAGLDSLPTGSVLASDTVNVDTVSGSSIPLSRIMRKAVFKSPVTFTSGGYVITVECDSTAVSAAVIANSWANKDGRRQNIGCGSVSGKWYRCLNLNIGGVTFDANMQYYPFVKYNFGTDFNVDNNCYPNTDTVRFTNTSKSNVSGSIFYNYYIYYNLEQFSHRWIYDNFNSQYSVNGKYKPAIKKNFKTQLISTVYSYSSGQCNDTAEKMVYFRPTLPAPKKAPSACRGDTITIDLVTDPNVIVKWFKKSSDTTPFNTGYSYTIQNAQKGDTFFVQAFNGPCKTTLSRLIFTLHDYPNNPTIKNDSICSGANANLSAKSNIGVIEWYNNATGGGSFYIGNNLQTNKLFKDTDFYVQANNQGCINKGGRAQVKAFVGSAFAPEKPIATEDTFACFKPKKAITLTASQKGTDTLRWFNQSTGGAVLKTGSTFSFNPSSRGDALYYVETWNGICGSGRTEITIHIYDYPTIFGLTGDTICAGDSAMPHLTIPWGEVHWYDKKSDLTPSFSGQKPKIEGLKSDKYYYLITEENGCTNSTWDSVKIFVNSPPVPTLVKADAVCSKGIGTFLVNVSVGKINWYYEQTDATPFFIGSTVKTGMMLSNITYYYETENKGCFSPKTAITVNIKPRPTAGFTWSLQWQNRLVCTPITTAGLTISWDWGDTKTSIGAPYNHIYATKGNYTVRMVATSAANGCKDTADIPVIIDHTSSKAVEISKVNMHPVPVQQNGVIHFSGMDFNGAQAEVYTTDGRLVYSSMITNDGIQLTNAIKSGVFVIKIRNSNLAWSARILVTD